MPRATEFRRNPQMTRDEEVPYAALLLGAWKRSRGSRLLVYVMAAMGVIDAVLTWISLEHFGTVGELNPVILRLYQAELLPLWSLITVVSSVLGGAVLVSVSLIFDGMTRSLAASAFGLLLGVRVAATTVSIANCYRIPFMASIGMLAGVAVFLVARKYLTSQVWISANMVFWFFRDFASELVYLWTRLSQVLLPLLDLKMISSSNHSLTDTMSRRSKGRGLRRVLTPIVLMAVALIALVGVLEFLRGHVFGSVPWWLRELGIVEQVQGQAFLLIFISILVALAVFTYCLLSIGEALSAPQP